MNHITYLRVRDGALAHSDEALDERGLLRDGYMVRRTICVMDSARVPAFFDEETARKFADVEARRERLSNAWREPAPQQRQPLAAELAALERRPTTSPARDAEAARAERDRRLVDAWRH
ncbi:hypothetical protein JQ580_25860 [Bradyrhizobium japonicum]|uniref:hypothetical protein n=1 Tax=Bradyrhizobium japonicum TaxID=375 RepID=UPI001BA869F6|nr:hypothetical protein [Bradyrhizobium japonicum]MBR0994152.1 hypothetical protein [Bradyrhizobium japonicum]